MRKLKVLIADDHDVGTDFLGDTDDRVRRVTAAAVDLDLEISIQHGSFDDGSGILRHHRVIGQDRLIDDITRRQTARY